MGSIHMAGRVGDWAKNWPVDIEKPLGVQGFLRAGFHHLATNPISFMSIILSLLMSALKFHFGEMGGP